MSATSPAAGLVTVSGPGSIWRSDYLSVGTSSGSSGTVSITNGASLVGGTNSGVSLGYLHGAKGTVIIDGANSTWTNSGIDLGDDGSGTLLITNGGSVSVAGATVLGRYADGAGAIDFGANGGTLTTIALLASPSQLSGVGTINTQGLVSDVDLKFDSTHGLTQTLALQQSGQNISLTVSLGERTTASEARAGRAMARSRFETESKCPPPTAISATAAASTGDSDDRGSRIGLDQRRA